MTACVNGRRSVRALKLLFAALILSLPTLRSAEAPAAAFRVVRLGQAVVSLPAQSLPREGGITLWLHLHGAPAVLEANFTAFEAPGVLVNVTLPGLSRVYAEYFADDATFGRLLSDIETVLSRHAPAQPRRLARVVVSSFSAGFGGVRQLLRQPAAFARIDALVMADSLYCGYAGDPALRQVDDALMADFLRFARLAAEGRKLFLLSHSRQTPDGYASTTETADYLLARLELPRRAVEAEAWPGGLSLRSRAERGGFEVLGFDGSGPEDHMRHLRNIGVLLRRVHSTVSTQ